MDLADVSDRDRFDQLAISDPRLVVHDDIRLQLIDLIQSENPSAELAESDCAARIPDRVGGQPLKQYGRWIYYPWSHRLVHTLPPNEYFLLRSDRNRNKITLEEQRRLRSSRIGIVGLSVGLATALTLVMEGVGGVFRLADFDSLSLSNMNRLHAALWDVGVPKTIIAARQMFEVDPYLDISIYPEGVYRDIVDAFLTASGTLDVLIEECDDLYAKVMVRERARVARIPVVMETSDRGLLDVERFDREPDRPILHGLLDFVRADQLKGLSTKDKVPYVMRIIDERAISTGLAASLVEVKETIYTWPQLASSVALGGAVVVDAVRRILLGSFTSSGRFYVDVESIVYDRAATPEAPALPLMPAVSSEAASATDSIARPLHNRAADVSRDAIRFVVAHAILAPSGGNMQPWKFRSRDRMCECLLDETAPEIMLDFQRSGSYFALGAAVENMVLAGKAIGLSADVALFPEPLNTNIVCRVHFDRSEASEDELFSCIVRRVTNRRLGDKRALDRGDVQALTRMAKDSGGHLRLLEGERDLAQLGALLGRGDRLRFLSERMHRELIAELRWSPAQVELTRTGIDIASLELTPSDITAMRILSNWKTMQFVHRFGGGGALERPARRVISSSSAVALLSMGGRGPSAYFCGGRTFQRLWLEATARDIAVQPYTALLYLFNRLEHDEGCSELVTNENVLLRELRGQFMSLYDSDDETRTDVMLFRLSHATPPSVRSLRRSVADVLTFVD